MPLLLLHKRLVHVLLPEWVSSGVGVEDVGMAEGRAEGADRGGCNSGGCATRERGVRWGRRRRPELAALLAAAVAAAGAAAAAVAREPTGRWCVELNNPPAAIDEAGHRCGAAAVRVEEQSPRHCVW